MENEIHDLYEKTGCFVGTLLVILCVIVALAIVFGVFCFEGWIFLLLWGWIAVGAFGAPALTYWVCVGIVFGLNFIGGLLFGRNIHIKTE